MNERQVSNKALELADKCGLMIEDYDFGLEVRDMLRSQEKYINQLHKLLNYNGIGAGKDLLTGEIIPFEVNE